MRGTVPVKIQCDSVMNFLDDQTKRRGSIPSKRRLDSWRVSQEAEVYIKEVNTCAYVKLVEGSPAVFSLGRSCAEMVYSHTWTPGRKPRLTRSEVTIECSSETHVPRVTETGVAGHLHLTKASTRRETPLQGWLQPFTAGIVDPAEAGRHL